MAGRIRQYHWESNRRQTEEGNLGGLFFLILIGLPLVIITKGQVLFLLAGMLIPVFVLYLFMS